MADPASLVLVATLANLSSIGSFLIEAVNTGRSLSKDESRRMLQSAATSKRETLSVETVALFESVDLTIVDALAQRAKRIEAEISKELLEGDLTPAKEQEIIDKIKAEVCRILRHMKSVNGGMLPDTSCNEKWVKFQCS